MKTLYCAFEPFLKYKIDSECETGAGNGKRKIEIQEREKWCMRKLKPFCNLKNSIFSRFPLRRIKKKKERVLLQMAIGVPTYILFLHI